MKLQLMGGVCKTHPSGSSLITSTHLAQHPHHYTHNGKDNKGETAPTATYIDIKVGNVTANACMAASERGDRKTITNGTTADADHYELTETTTASAGADKLSGGGVDRADRERPTSDRRAVFTDGACGNNRTFFHNGSSRSESACRGAGGWGSNRDGGGCSSNQCGGGCSSNRDGGGCSSNRDGGGCSSNRDGGAAVAIETEGAAVAIDAEGAAVAIETVPFSSTE